MAKKILNVTLIQKHDIEANWNRVSSFIPDKAEIIVYDIDDNHKYERFKIGDGKTAIANLPFYLEEELTHVVNNMLQVSCENGELSFTKGIPFTYFI